jgi:hypothetical protein
MERGPLPRPARDRPERTQHQPDVGVCGVFLPQSRRMGLASAIAMDANQPKARIIPDVFHMHICDSGFNGLKHLEVAKIGREEKTLQVISKALGW